MPNRTRDEDAAVEAFRRAAREYCAFLEKHRELEAFAFLKGCHHRLATVHAYALSLPEAQDAAPAAAQPAVSDGADALYAEIQAKVKVYDSYWLVYHPYKKEEPSQASLADGLSDIYKDLKEALAAESVWSWKMAHRARWGKHAVGTLAALQDLEEAV